MSIKGYSLKIEGLSDSLTSIDVHSTRKAWHKYASMACHKDLAHLELSSSKETFTISNLQRVFPSKRNTMETISGLALNAEFSSPIGILAVIENYVNQFYNAFCHEILIFLWEREIVGKRCHPLNVVSLGIRVYSASGVWEMGSFDGLHGVLTRYKG